MTRITAFIDSLDLQALVAILALLGLGLGVALVTTPGWGLVVVSALVLVYIVLPDQKAAP